MEKSREISIFYYSAIYIGRWGIEKFPSLRRTEKWEKVKLFPFLQRTGKLEKVEKFPSLCRAEKWKKSRDFSIYPTNGKIEKKSRNFHFLLLGSMGKVEKTLDIFASLS